MRGVAFVAVLGLGASCAPAQTSELYINQLDNNGMVVVQNGAVVRSWNTINPAENALAVAGTIRTAGSWWLGNGAGAEYDLSGAPTGPTYSIIGGGNWFDGTTDGMRYNYAVQHNGDYNLYRFDRDWSNPQVMYNVGFATSGITYDASDNTLWVSDSLSLLVRHMDLAGNVLSSFTASANTYAYGLALDPADGTLWVGGYGSNMIHQYDQAGNLLSSVAVRGIGSGYGMEFNIPSPGAAVLLALAGLSTARRRR